MEIIQHNKQITRGSVLVCIQDATFGITTNDCLKVENTIGAYKVEFEKPNAKYNLGISGSWRFRKAYKNEERLCKI